MASYKKLQLSHLYPHSAIVSAVEASLELDDQMNLKQFSDDMLNTLQQLQPAHVVQAESGLLELKKYHFFAGWHLFHELRRRGMTTIYAVVHQAPLADIEERAVMAELGMSSLVGINECYQASAFQLLRKHELLWPKIFSGDRPRTPATALESLCGISRSAAQRIAAPTTPPSKPSLLEEMLSKQSKGNS